MGGCVVAYEDDEWPEELGSSGTHASQKGAQKEKSGTTDAETLKRFAVRKKTDVCLYNASSQLAAVALGFDIRSFNSARGGRASNASSADDASAKSAAATKKRDAHIGQRRDAYLAAVRDNFLHEPSPLHDVDFAHSSAFRHNTYHGVTARHRPTVDFTPMRFTETGDAQQQPQAQHDAMHVNGDASHDAPLQRAPVGDDAARNLALMSLSPSQDRQFIDVQRQLSDTSSSAYDTPTSTPKVTPQRMDSAGGTPSVGGVVVRFKESHASYTSTPLRSPTVKFSDQREYEGRGSPLHTDSQTPSPLLPPPPPSRRTDHTPTRTPPSAAAAAAAAASAERPVTLDITPRPRRPSILKSRTSPAHAVILQHQNSRATSTPSDSLSTGDDSFTSAPSGFSPATTTLSPAPEQTETSLLDIDVEGQRDDTTKPLALKHAHNLGVF